MVPRILGLEGQSFARIRIPTWFRVRAFQIGSLDADHTDFYCVESDNKLLQASYIFEYEVSQKKLKYEYIYLDYCIHLSNIFFNSYKCNKANCALEFF